MSSCPIPRPELQELWDRFANSFSSNVLGGAPLIPESNEWYVVSNDVLAADYFYSVAEREWAERDPRTACCDNLVNMASDDGVYPRPAAAARGYVTLTGTAGSALNAAMKVQFGDSIYKVFNVTTVPAVMPAGGSLTLQFVAETAGSAANAPTTSMTGSLLTAMAGVDSVVTAAGNKFCGGGAAEDCESFRTRYLDRTRFKPNFTFERLREAALDWPCATRVFLRGETCCEPDTGCDVPMHIYVMFDDTFAHGCAPDEICDELTEYLFGAAFGDVNQKRGLGIAEIGVTGSVKTVTPAPVSITLAGVACGTQAQQTEIRRRIEEIFAGLAPATELCRNLFVGTIASVAPSLCDFDITVTTTSPLITVTDCGDIVPDCDVLPYLAELKIV